MTKHDVKLSSLLSESQAKGENDGKQFRSNYLIFDITQSQEHSSVEYVQVYIVDCRILKKSKQKIPRNPKYQRSIFDV